MTWPTKTDFVDGDVLTATQVNNIGTNLNAFDPTSATLGQVPVADGAGDVAWGAVSAFTQVASGNLTGGTTTTISAIPGTYVDLVLLIRDLYGTSLNTCSLQFNGETGTQYTYANFGINNTSVRALTGTNYTEIPMFPTTIGTISNTRAFIQVRIHDYASAARQGVFAQTAGRDGSGFAQTLEVHGHFNTNNNSPAAITSITIKHNTTPTNGTYVLYGVK